MIAARTWAKESTLAGVYPREREEPLLTHLPVVLTRRRGRIVAILPPCRMGEVDDGIAVVGDDGVVEHQRPIRRQLLNERRTRNGVPRSSRRR